MTASFCKATSCKTVQDCVVADFTWGHASAGRDRSKSSSSPFGDSSQKPAKKVANPFGPDSRSKPFSEPAELSPTMKAIPIDDTPWYKKITVAQVVSITVLSVVKAFCMLACLAAHAIYYTTGMGLAGSTSRLDLPGSNLGICIIFTLLAAAVLLFHVLAVAVLLVLAAHIQQSCGTRCGDCGDLQQS